MTVGSKTSVRGYYNFMGCYYAASIVKAMEHAGGEPDYVMVGKYFREGGTEGEFRFVEDSQTGSVKLEVFADGLRALLEFNDVVAAVAERTAHGRLSIPELCKLMDSMGVADLTDRTPKASDVGGS